MQHEIAALENSIVHLLQTNAEIREEHDIEDPDLRLAVEENTTVQHELMPSEKTFDQFLKPPVLQYLFLVLFESECIAARN